VSPHTALRVALTSSPAALVVRRPGGPVHLHTWPRGEVGRGVLARGARPVCGLRGRRWLLARSVGVDDRLCGRCSAWAYARLTADVTVPDGELAALVRGAVWSSPSRPLWALTRVGIHLVVPWRHYQPTVGLDGRPAYMGRLLAQVRERVKAAPRRRREQTELLADRESA